MWRVLGMTGEGKQVTRDLWGDGCRCKCNLKHLLSSSSSSCCLCCCSSSGMI